MGFGSQLNKLKITVLVDLFSLNNRLAQNLAIPLTNSVAIQ